MKRHGGDAFGGTASEVTLLYGVQHTVVGSLGTTVPVAGPVDPTHSPVGATPSRRTESY
jgi:hypothetical protein